MTVNKHKTPPDTSTHPTPPKAYSFTHVSQPVTVTGCLCPARPAPRVLAQTPGPTNPSLAGGELTAGQAGGPTPGGRGGTQRLEPPAASRGLDLVACALGTWEHPTGRCAGDQTPPGLKSRPPTPSPLPSRLGSSLLACTSERRPGCVFYPPRLQVFSFLRAASRRPRNF